MPEAARGVPRCGSSDRPSGEGARGLVQRIAHPARRRPRRARRRGRDPARPKWGGQDDHAQIHHGDRRQTPGLGDVRGKRADRPADRAHRPARGRALPGRARRFTPASRVGKIFVAASRIGRRDEHREDLRAFSRTLRERRREPRRARSRAASSRCWRLHGFCAPERRVPAARRSDRRAGARPRPADRPRDRELGSKRGLQFLFLSSRISGSPRSSPTGSSSWSTAASSTPSRDEGSRAQVDPRTRLLGVE